jgi:putative transposase
MSFWRRSPHTPTAPGLNGFLRRAHRDLSPALRVRHPQPLRRRVVHSHVTTAPTAAWVSKQLREAFPFETAPRYLIRDRDSIYGDQVRRCLAGLKSEEELTASRSPWHNPYVERIIGAIRRECLDHVLVVNERHLRHILSAYLDYYHLARPHLGLGHNVPEPPVVEPPARDRVVAEPMAGGLHHCDRRCA